MSYGQNLTETISLWQIVKCTISYATEPQTSKCQMNVDMSGEQHSLMNAKFSLSLCITESFMKINRYYLINFDKLVKIDQFNEFRQFHEHFLELGGKGKNCKCPDLKIFKYIGIGEFRGRGKIPKPKKLLWCYFQSYIK